MRLSDYGSSIILLTLICMAQALIAQASPPVGQTMSSADFGDLQGKAQAGDPLAQLNLGKAYEDGDGVHQSDNQAFKWYRAAAEQGNAAAQNDVGVMLRLGRGVEQDKKEAVEWFRRAAKQENPNALFNLGAAYFNGDGVGIDDTIAYSWFLLAQNFGSDSGAEAVKRMKDEKAPLESDALERIGDMYQAGHGLPQSSTKALDWYRKGAEHGASRVQVKLAGRLILENPTRTTDLEEACHLCEKAAKAHFGPGAYCMGHLYREGLGIRRDPAKSVKWYLEAADLGVVAAAWQLGEMYWNGEGVIRDRIFGYEFIYIAAISNLPEARQEQERMEKELTPKEMERGKAKAKDWCRRHGALLVMQK